MAKFCTVAPTQILTEMDKHSCLGVNHLLLAHDVVKHVLIYERLFAEDNIWRAEGHVILDNSAYELKRSVDTLMVWEAADITRPDVIVLPDVYLDGPGTVRETTKVFDDWMRIRESAPWKSEFMVIPQGKTFEEWVRCAEAFAGLPEIEWWGVPRNFREVLKRSRMEGIDICHALNPYRKIHLFGFSDDYIDDLITARDPLVYSIDSTTPIRVGSLGLPFSLVGDYPPRGDWWDTGQWHEAIALNLQFANRVFGG